MKIFIGIDPAFRKNGFGMCVIDRNDNTVNFKVFKDYIEFFGWLLNDSPLKAVFCVENSNLQDITFQRYDFKGNKIATSHNASRNAGKNMAVSQLTVDALTAKYRDNVYGVSPKEKGAKITNLSHFEYLVNDCKLNMYNYKGTQDERDSFQLAYLGEKKYKLYKMTK